MIRQANERDIPAIQRVASETWHATYEGIINRDAQDRFIANAYSQHSMENRVKGMFYIAEEQGDVIGFGNFSKIEGKTFYIGALYVLPTHQGKGIGTRLLQYGLDRMEDWTEVEVDVEKENAQGVRFYEKHGFTKKKEYEDELFGDTFRTLRMVTVR
ncbi:GNAT family acetyltransferase [Pontibacillus halophilus JSM 076056 = DSM 19796]|uniref:GNAT family acetyltransferase n=1 Tax=Pontibacillus halophilus JSM 076056 = DSM 19796 TaxID=1385510 RepID=A0A0A5GMF8_9BACI|nr:GNAT family N-acetyltransferase [Pontibacillus halophilus]KGX92350.1 GNAT family acetyltransferase [Pontibacillus halophilus JSM 076056 = DSM 19796]